MFYPSSPPLYIKIYFLVSRINGLQVAMVGAAMEGWKRWVCNSRKLLRDKLFLSAANGAVKAVDSVLTMASRFGAVVWVAPVVGELGFGQVL